MIPFMYRRSDSSTGMLAAEPATYRLTATNKKSPMNDQRTLFAPAVGLFQRNACGRTCNLPVNSNKKS
ncbi:MAG: hypothetical protein JXR46_13315, partial [Calditrichaceae bacterium]|nr:hypothetical protein [Calditrichaceae bacterium]MBN2710015.1 hypothetical protein [Calditrichaceae bacterium]